MKFNINDIAEVKLTEYGLVVLNRHYLSSGVKPAGLNENVLEVPVWYLMFLFGNHLFMGATDIVFENNEIEIIRTVK